MKTTGVFTLRWHLDGKTLTLEGRPELRGLGSQSVTTPHLCRQVELHLPFCSEPLAEGFSVSSGCSHKIPWPGWLAQQKVVSYDQEVESPRLMRY